MKVRTRLLLGLIALAAMVSAWQLGLSHGVDAQASGALPVARSDGVARSLTQAGTITVRVDPATQTVQAGETFTVAIVGELGTEMDANGLGAYEFDLADALGYTEVITAYDAGELGSTGNSVVPVGPLISTTTGVTVSFGATAYPGESGSYVDGPKGEVRLATVELIARQAGTAQLDLHNVLLADTQLVVWPGDGGSLSLQGGTVEVSGLPEGDVNGDSSVNIFDAQMTINMILHSPQPDSALYPLDYWERADVMPQPDGDGVWNIFDAQRIICLILGTCGGDAAQATADDGLRYVTESGSYRVPQWTVPAAGETVTAPSGSNVTSIGDVYADPDTSAAFDINLANEDAVTSAQIVFTYDSTIGLDVTGVSPTTRTDGYSVSSSKNETDPSAVVVTIVVIDFSGSLTISPGSGSIVSVQYSLAEEASGSSPLDLTTVLLSDAVGNPLASDWQDGHFYVNTTQYTLTVNPVGNGSVTLDPAGGVYTGGAEVELTAVADPGWAFSGWSGDLSGSTNPETITMHGDKTVTATFVTATAPDTLITAHPDHLSLSRDATFSFTSTEPDSTFECHLDGGGFTACTSPHRYTNLDHGQHTFEVRAIGPAGNPDPSPDSFSWTISRAIYLPLINRMAME